LRRAFALAAALAAIGAQADETSAPAELGPIVVTPARIEQAPFDVPAAIDVISAREIDANRLGINVSETLSTLPGVLARDRQNYAQDQQISVRGFGTRAPFGIVGVRLYVDGIPATMPDGQGQVSHFNLDSAERIEVLRGPFATLYGNAAGGVIQIFTAPGTLPPQAELEAVAGSYGTVRSSVNLRGAQDFLDYNVDFTHFQTDGTRGHAWARRESGNARVSFDLHGGRRLTLVANTVAIPHAQDPLGLTRDQFEHAPRAASPVAEQFNTRKSVRQTQEGLVFEQRLPLGQSLRLMGYHGDRAVEQFLAIPTMPQASPTHSGGVVDLDNDYQGGDLRWTLAATPLDRALNVVVGLSYDLQRSHRLGYENFVGTELGVKGNRRRDEDNRTFDFDQYAQLGWDFARDWSLLAGVRNNHVRLVTADHYVTTGNGDDSGAIDYRRVTPAVALMYSAHPHLRTYASYGEAFDSPTFAEIAYRPDGASGLNTDLKPARTRNGELGVKWQVTPATFSHLAVFDSLTRDEIIVAGASGGRSTYQNAGHVRRIGAELGAENQLAEKWKVQAAYTFLHAKFRDPFTTCLASACPGVAPLTTIPRGRRVPGVPASNAFVALRYGGATGWNGAMETTFLSAIEANSSNTFSAPAHVLVGASGGYVWDVGHWRVKGFARVDNILNRNYAGSVIVNDTNQRYYEPGPARSAFAGVDIRVRY
jgi:iron complex outermembrane receptor protein